MPKEPTPLPEGFYWDEMDVTNDELCQEYINFIQDHYVEEPNGHFKLYYPLDKFRWSLITPGYNKDLHFCVRSSKNKKIMATICANPRKYVMCGKTINKVAEGNFLCVH